jgi:hypothetical protein
MTAPDIADPLGPADMAGACDIMASLGDVAALGAGPVDAGAFVPLPLPQAAKTMTAAAVRAMVRNLTSRVSCRWRSSVHAITDRPLEAAWGDVVIDMSSRAGIVWIRNPSAGV